MSKKTPTGNDQAGGVGASVEKLVKLLDFARQKVGCSTFEIFTRALSVWYAALRGAEMEEWLEACRGVEKGLAPLGVALWILLAEASNNYQDLLGLVYMRLGQNDTRLFAQYFTPWPAAKALAEMSLVGLEERCANPGGEPLRILDPACGSGVMLLAYADTIVTRCPELIDRGEVEFFGVDIDETCVKMARLNFLLHCLGRKGGKRDLVALMMELFAGMGLLDPAEQAAREPGGSRAEVLLRTLFRELGKDWGEPRPGLDPTAAAGEARPPVAGGDDSAAFHVRRTDGLQGTLFEAAGVELTNDQPEDASAVSPAGQGGRSGARKRKRVRIYVQGTLFERTIEGGEDGGGRG